MSVNIATIVEAAFAGDLSPYQAADRSAKAKVKAAVRDQLNSAVLASDLVRAQEAMSVEKALAGATASTVSRETKSPAQVIAERVAILREAADQLVAGITRPDGWEGTYPTHDEIAAVMGDLAESAWKPAATKLAAQKITRTGQRRNVLAHVREVLAAQDDPSLAMKVRDIAKQASSEYPEADCSEGAIAARFWTADGYKGDSEGLHGIEADEMPDGKGRGVRIA
jgi:exoribonuclease R